MTFSGHTGYGLLFFLSQPDSGLNHGAVPSPLPDSGLNHGAGQSPLPDSGLNHGAGQSPLPQGEGQGEGDDDG
ncbi:hypothetical protein NUKP23_20090 [Klebsiella variicola]|nr:hypothetical protein NUKP6_27560 [Klebsiella variicola]GKJ06730.1 hypothetical protein NUKP23_20090 [Klebsiella variicola]GKK36422.1 hypothetical protein NUKP39_33790 [Klebsiella variicola]